jgi:hypothetical protein
MIVDNPGVPLSSGRGGNFRPDSAHHWRDTLLDVSVLAGKSNVYMMFENKSQQMGNLYVDDIVLDRRTIVSSSDLNLPTDWSILPNPSNGEFQILARENDQFRVLDLHGRVVERFIQKAASQTISLERLPKGVYLLERNSEGKSSYKKIMIQ